MPENKFTFLMEKCVHAMHLTFYTSYLIPCASLHVEEEIDERPHKFGGFGFAHTGQKRTGELDETAQF